MGSDAPRSGRLRTLVPARVRRSYALKLGVAFLAIILVIGAVGGVIYVQTDRVLAEDTNEQIEGTTQVQAENLGKWIGLMKEEARLLSRSQEVENDDAKQVRAFLVNEVEEAGRLPDEVIGIHYLDTSEFVIETSTNEQFVGVSPREEGVEWAQEGLSFEGSDDVAVKGPFESPMNGEPVIAIISPVPGIDRALVVMVDLKTRAQEMPQPADGHTSVVDADGTVVLNHRTDRMLEQNAGGPGVDSSPVDRGIAGETGTTQMETDDGAVLVGYAPVEGTDWVLTTNVPRSEAFALQQTITRNLLVLILASIFGLGAVGLTIGRSTSRSLEELSDRAATIAEDDLDVEIPETAREDELGQLYGSFDEMQSRVSELVEDVEAERERAQAAREEAEEVSRRLEATAAEYGDTMRVVASGDLTKRLDPDVESDAMALIAEAFNTMLDEWNDTVVHVRQFADEVVTEIEHVSNSVDELERSSQEVSESIQEISSGAADQTEKLQEVSNTMNDLSATIEEVAASADEVANTARRAAETGETGRDAAEEAVDAMSEIEARTDETVSEVENLRREVDKIGEVVELITDIAEQTNLLALNASIEAARAGEAGEGFAVVADEVKSLAEETKAATEEIEDSITRIQQRTEDTVGGITEMQQSVSEGTETVEEAIEALERIVEYVEDTNAGVQEINTATDDQATSTQEVVATVDEVASISEQTASQSEDVAAASEEQTSATSEVSRTAGDLSVKADTLRDLLDDFDLEEDVDDEPTAGADPTAATDPAVTDGGED